MTVLGIFGAKTDASDKLVTAALNDLLEAHISDTPDDPFWLCVGVNKNSQATIYMTIAKWAVRNEIHVSWYTTMKLPELTRDLEISGTDEYRPYTSEAGYLSELVERLYKESRNKERAKIFALLGDKEPSVDVRRALARAMDYGLEVRDLAEAGLTYVGVSDNPIRQGSNHMATDDLTLAQAGEAADEGDEESMAALVDLAEQYNMDPDEYPTWSALAEAIDPLMSEAPPEDEEEEEAPAPKSRAATEELDESELESKSVPELRQLAKQLGVDGWETNRSAKLIAGILAAQGNGDAPAPAGDDDKVVEGFLEAVAFDGISATALARGLRAFADALED